MSDDERCYRGPDRVRLLVDRHQVPHPEGEVCAGCWPCHRTHCADCDRVHVDQAVVCDGCLGRVRDTLGLVLELYDHLLDEALRGQQRTRELPGGEATVALGPWSYGTGDLTTDRWTEWRAYSEANVWPSDWHPVLSLETWGEMWRDWSEQEHPTVRATLSSAVGYLDRHLSAINTAQPRGEGAVVEHPPEFTDLVTEVTTVRLRLETVLHDGIRQQSGAPCLRCNTNLVRVEDPATGGLTDDWRCPTCHRHYDSVQYVNAVAAGYAVVQMEVIETPLGDRETWGTVARAAIETRRSERTIRTWMREGHVRQACLLAGRRRVVSVDDARDEDQDRARRYRSAARSA